VLLQSKLLRWFVGFACHRLLFASCKGLWYDTANQFFVAFSRTSIEICVQSA
jgi:hypothetical protein